MPIVRSFLPASKKAKHSVCGMISMVTRIYLLTLAPATTPHVGKNGIHPASGPGHRSRCLTARPWTASHCMPSHVRPWASQQWGSSKDSSTSRDRKLKRGGGFYFKAILRGKRRSFSLARSVDWSTSSISRTFKRVGTPV